MTALGLRTATQLRLFWPDFSHLRLHGAGVPFSLTPNFSWCPMSERHLLNRSIGFSPTPNLPLRASERWYLRRVQRRCPLQLTMPQRLTVPPIPVHSKPVQEFSCFNVPAGAAQWVNNWTHRIRKSITIWARTMKRFKVNPHEVVATAAFQLANDHPELGVRQQASEGFPLPRQLPDPVRRRPIVGSISQNREGKYQRYEQSSHGLKIQMYQKPN